MYFTGEEQNPKPNQNNKKQSANKKKNTIRGNQIHI